MAFLVIAGGGSRVTSDRPRTPEISAAVLNFRNSLVNGGAKVLTTRLGAGGIEIDWLPADAEPDLEPIRSSILLPGTTAAAALAAFREDLPEEEIPVELDDLAIESTEVQEPSNIVRLAAWIKSRDL